MESDCIGGRQNGNVNDNVGVREKPPRVRKRTKSSIAKGKRQVGGSLLLIIRTDIIYHYESMNNLCYID